MDRQMMTVHDTPTRPRVAVRMTTAVHAGEPVLALPFDVLRRFAETCFDVGAATAVNTLQAEAGVYARERAARLAAVVRDAALLAWVVLLLLLGAASGAQAQTGEGHAWIEARNLAAGRDDADNLHEDSAIPVRSGWGVISFGSGAGTSVMDVELDARQSECLSTDPGPAFICQSGQWLPPGHPLRQPPPTGQVLTSAPPPVLPPETRPTCVGGVDPYGLGQCLTPGVETPVVYRAGACYTGPYVSFILRVYAVVEDPNDAREPVVLARWLPHPGSNVNGPTWFRPSHPPLPLAEAACPSAAAAPPDAQTR